MSDDPVLAALLRLQQSVVTVGVEIRHEVAELRADMSARFDRVEDKLTRLRDEVDLAMGRLDEVGSAAEGSSATQRQLWRLYRRLQTDVDELKDRK